MALTPVHIVEFSPNWEGGIGGFEWHRDRAVIDEKTLQFMTEDPGYTVTRWTVMIDEDMDSVDVTLELDRRINDREQLGEPKFKGESLEPREALKDLTKLAILGGQFKDDTLWAHYFRTVGREDDPVVKEIDERRIKAAEDMDKIRAKFGF